MASDPGDTVLDPFGGTGTTFAAAELLGRHWVGIDLHAAEAIARLTNLKGDKELLSKIQSGKNVLFTKEALEKRTENKRPLGKFNADYSVKMSGLARKRLEPNRDESFELTGE